MTDATAARELLVQSPQWVPSNSGQSMILDASTVAVLYNLS